MPPKKKCRQYLVEYLKFGFIPSPSNEQLPMCLLCNSVFSNEAMKPSRLQEHLNKKHPDKANADIAYFQGLKDRHANRKTIKSLFDRSTVVSERGLKASYAISLLITRTGKPHSIGEMLIKPAISEVIKTVLDQDPTQVLSAIPLSNNTVSRRIDEMGRDVENQLCHELRNTKFSLQLDESTLRDNEALLLCYVRFIRGSELVEEMLFARPLETDTKGESIFRVVETFFREKGIPLENIIACATDGAPSMTGRQRGFVSHLKRAIPGIFVIHCVIHRHHLAAKNLSGKLYDSIQIVVKAINKIKSHSLNDRIFRKLCHDNEEEFERLIFHTEVRWLSKGNCLKRCYDLFDTVVEFLQGVDSGLSDTLSGIRHDVAYLTDIFSHLNSANIQMQGNKMTLVKVKSIMSTLIAKLGLYRQQIGRKEFFHFPCLAEQAAVDDNILLVYCQHLEALEGEMNRRFQDLMALEIPAWVLDPFTVRIDEVKLEIQDELISLQNDVESKTCYLNSGYEGMWVAHKQDYPLLWQTVQLLIMAFPTSYLVERGFSAVLQLLTKQRNRLEISERGDLRLRLTDMEPDIQEMVKTHQAQPSH